MIAQRFARKTTVLIQISKPTIAAMAAGTISNSQSQLMGFAS